MLKKPSQTSFLLMLIAILTATLCVHIACRASGEAPFSAARKRMLEYDIKGRDIHNTAVLKAMQTVPRHLFVPESLRHQAYGDYPLPIDEGQTISQPYIVALMTQALDLKKSDRVLEIGTGSGYQAAVLAEIVSMVYTIEIKPALAEKASALLASLGYRNIRVKSGDGFFGWKEHAPFDAILLTCAADRIPPALRQQLKDGGKLIMPMGGLLKTQRLVVATRKGHDMDIRNVLPVRFVPMTGEIRKSR